MCLFVTIVLNSLLTQTLRVRRDGEGCRRLARSFKEGLAADVLQHSVHGGQRRFGGFDCAVDDARVWVDVFNGVCRGGRVCQRVLYVGGELLFAAAAGAPGAWVAPSSPRGV